MDKDLRNKFLNFSIAVCKDLYFFPYELVHTTYKLYMSSMTIEFLALLAQTIYWADYALTGKDKLNWKNLGKLSI